MFQVVIFMRTCGVELAGSVDGKGSPIPCHRITQPVAVVTFREICTREYAPVTAGDRDIGSIDWEFAPRFSNLRDETGGQTGQAKIVG
jgi:hypothetical protein